MKQKTHESELPAGYQKIYYLNAKDKKVGILFNLIALVIMVAVFVIGVLPLMNTSRTWEEISGTVRMLFPLGLILVMLIYIVFHELVHGIAYKVLTGQKLTFGLSWSCAFCGVPAIYTYRKTALVALLAPFVVFDLVFGALVIWFFFLHPIFYIGALVLLGLHVGGCCGDLYVTLLFLFRYRDPNTLMKDTGPEQTFYILQ